MHWEAAVVKEDGRIQLVVSLEQKIPGEIHIVPCTEDGDFLRFGIHEFTPKCACGPKLKEIPGSQSMWIHTEKVN